MIRRQVRKILLKTDKDPDQIPAGGCQFSDPWGFRKNFVEPSNFSCRILNDRLPHEKKNGYPDLELPKRRFIAYVKVGGCSRSQREYVENMKLYMLVAIKFCIHRLYRLHLSTYQFHVIGVDRLRNS